MRLTKYEQETTINYNALDGICTVYTCNPADIRKFDKLVSAKESEWKLIKEDEVGKTYEFSKKLLQFRAKRIKPNLSEDQREEIRKRFEEVRKRKTVKKQNM